VLAVGEAADELRELVVDRGAASRLARPLSQGTVGPRQRHRPQMPAADAEGGEVDAVLDADAEEHAGLLVGARQSALRALPGR
jgi:hypothetical protein